MLLLSAAHALAQTTYHVDVTNCPGPGSGTVGDPFCSIQAGIDAAVGGDTVLVAPGTYFEGIDFLGKPITVRGDQGAAVTTIQGDYTYLLVQFENGEGRDSVLDGMTLTKGSRAMRIFMTSPTVTNCRFINNRTFTRSGAAMTINAGAFPEISDCLFHQNVANDNGNSGGAIRITGADALITNCTFSANHGRNGGALLIGSSGANGVTVTDCEFTGNSCTEDGGAVHLWDDSSKTLVNCVFRNNTGHQGSALYYKQGPITVTNCVFVGNFGDRAAVYSSGHSGTFANCTIAGNTATAAATAGAEVSSGDAFGNCILWGNIANGVTDQLAQVSGAGSPAIDYSLVQGWDGTLGGVGNSGGDPLFVDLAFGDVHPGIGSAAIDAGDNSVVPAGVTTDLEGSLRFLDDPTVPDTGAGTAPIVDIGAYEIGDCNNNGVYDAADIDAGTSLDCNGNGRPDECENDCNENGVADGCDINEGTSDDCNTNGIPDECEYDCNANGIPDDCDAAAGTSADCNANGIPDECEFVIDCNTNGILDVCDIAEGTSDDCTNNGIPDECEPDCNGTGVADSCDIQDGTSSDCNFNGIPDACDLADGTSEDCDGDGIPDECETDCNGNGVADECDIADGTSDDCNINEIPDECESYEDCNMNEVLDACDIADGTSDDCTDNGIPDECEPDCNGNSAADSCEIQDGTSSDCNVNGVPDECDLAEGESEDCNTNGVPDECEADCNGNGVADDCDIAGGTSEDCDTNGIPDECETDCNNNGVLDDCDIAAGTSDDCNTNGVPDECELEEDCNMNGVPDVCDVADGTSEDCNVDGIPDECQPDEDCNGNSVTDICDIGSGVSLDCQGNLIPDDCDITSGTSQDEDGNGIPDECDCGSASAPTPDDISPSGPYGTKNRYLSVTVSDALTPKAIQVTFVSVPAYEYAKGRRMWVQEPFKVSEASGYGGDGPEPTFWAAELGCTPYYTDWGGFGTMDIYDAGIRAGGTLDVRVILDGCDTALPVSYSEPLTVFMSAAGDVAGSTCTAQTCNAPQGVIDFVDISAIVDKFRNSPGAIRKARADIINATVLIPIPDRKIDLVDISACVEAFRGHPVVTPGPPVTDPCE
jgi:hypothetical protein